MGTLIEGMLSKGVKVTGFTTTPDLPPGESLRVSSSTHDLSIAFCGWRKNAFRYRDGYVGRGSDFFKYERRALLREVVRTRPDIVHAHWSYEFGLVALKSGLPHLVTAHDSPKRVLKYDRSLYRLMRFWMGRKCLRDAKNITAVSPTLLNDIKKYLGSTGIVVPNPIPPLIHTLPLELDNKTKRLSRPIIAMVMNGWSRYKNPEVAIKAFNEIKALNRDATLRIYGQAFEEGGVAQKWATDKGVSEGIEFKGSLPHDALIRELASAHVLLHPALEEACPMGVIEALALGIPVVGGKASGGVPWVVGDAGALVDVESVSEIRDGVMSIISEEERYRAFCQLARSSAQERFSLNVITDQYFEIYQNILNSTA